MVKPRLLIIEDDVDFLKCLEQVLQTDYHCESTSSVKGALAILKNRSFDLILSDHHLGQSTAKDIILEFAPEKPIAPFLIMSGHLSREDVLELANLRVLGVIEKPFSDDLLLEKIEKSLSLSQVIFKHFPNATEEYIIDREAREVRFKNRVISLTLTEIKLLGHMMARRGQVMYKREFQNLVNEGRHSSRNLVQTHILNLKRKLPELEHKLKTIRNQGYKLEF